MALTFAGARLPTLALGRFLKSLVVGAIVVVLMVDGGLGWCMVDHDVQLHGGNDVWWSVVVGGRIDRIIGSRRNGGKKWSETLLDQSHTDETRR